MCIHIYTYIHRHIYMAMVSMCVHTYIYIYIYIHIGGRQTGRQIDRQANTQPCVCVHAYMFLYIFRIHIPMHTPSYRFDRQLCCSRAALPSSEPSLSLPGTKHRTSARQEHSKFSQQKPSLPGQPDLTNSARATRNPGFMLEPTCHYTRNPLRSTAYTQFCSLPPTPR